MELSSCSMFVWLCLFKTICNVDKCRFIHNLWQIMTDTFFTDSNKSRMCAYMHIFCVSSGTQECKILPSSRFFPPAEDHSFSTRLSGQLPLLSVAPQASFLFISFIHFFLYSFIHISLFLLPSGCVIMSQFFFVFLCVFLNVCVLCVAFVFVFKRDLSHLTARKLWLLETHLILVFYKKQNLKTLPTLKTM